MSSCSGAVRGALGGRAERRRRCCLTEAVMSPGETLREEEETRREVDRCGLARLASTLSQGLALAAAPALRGSPELHAGLQHAQGVECQPPPPPPPRPLPRSRSLVLGRNASRQRPVRSGAFPLPRRTEGSAAHVDCSRSLRTSSRTSGDALIRSFSTTSTSSISTTLSTHSFSIPRPLPTCRTTLANKFPP